MTAVPRVDDMGDHDQDPAAIRAAKVGTARAVEISLETFVYSYFGSLMKIIQRRRTLTMHNTPPNFRF